MWEDSFTFGGPAGPTVGIVLEQHNEDRFFLRSEVRFVGDRSKVTESVARRIDDPQRVEAVTDELLYVLPTHLQGDSGGDGTDLASVPPPVLWLLRSYGRHTPAALLHDRFTGSDSDKPDGVDQHLVDEVFLRVLEASGVPWLRRNMMWAAVTANTKLKGTFAGRVGLIAWIISSIIGMALLGLFVFGVLGGWAAAVAVGLPFVAAVFWGKDWRAAALATVTAPFVIPPTLLGLVGYQIYWLAEQPDPLP